MARRVRTVIDIFDDLDGQLITEGNGETLTYVWDGSLYEIDLSNAHAGEVRKTMQPLLDKSRRVGRVSPRTLTGSTPKPRQRPEVGTGASVPALPAGWLTERPEGISATQWSLIRRAQFREIREWAQTNGWPNQGMSGRIFEGVREAWNETHPDRIAPDEEAK